MKRKINLSQSPSPQKPIQKTIHITDPFSDLAAKLSLQIEQQLLEKKRLQTKDILLLAGTGLFLGATLVAPNITPLARSFLRKNNEQEYNLWKRFNIPYLKRTLQRLEHQKLIEITEQKDTQTVTITEKGKKKTMKYAIDSLTIPRPKTWDKTWRLVSYDIPTEQRKIRHIFYEYLHTWHFYPLHESVLLHAYPCEEQVTFLKTYLGIEKYVRIFTVSKIENDQSFRIFFNV